VARLEGRGAGVTVKRKRACQGYERPIDPIVMPATLEPPRWRIAVLNRRCIGNLTATAVPTAGHILPNERKTCSALDTISPPVIFYIFTVSLAKCPSSICKHSVKPEPTTGPGSPVVGCRRTRTVVDPTRSALVQFPGVSLSDLVCGGLGQAASQFRACCRVGNICVVTSRF
jgi:hypothetical protein